MLAHTHHLAVQAAQALQRHISPVWVGRGIVSATNVLMERRVMQVPRVVQRDVVKWHVQPGQAVQSGDNIAQVLTDRGVVDIRTDISGVVTRYLTTDEALEKGSEFYEVEIDSDVKPYGHLLDEGNQQQRKTRFLRHNNLFSSRGGEETSLAPEIRVHNGTGRDLKVVALSHKGHTDLQSKFRDILKKAAVDILADTLEDGMKKKATDYFAKKAAEDRIKNSAKLQQKAFEKSLESLPPDEYMVTTIHGDKARTTGSHYYEDVPFPSTLQTEDDNWEAFVTAYSPYDGKYFFTNMLAPCARKYYIFGEPHEQFPGFESN